MGIRINVDPSRLEMSATRIEQQIVLYEKTYHHLYQNVEALSAGWKGKDNQAFVQQIKGFESDFKTMSVIIKEYANFLKTGAKAYRNLQNDRMLQARKLQN